MCKNKPSRIFMCENILEYKYKTITIFFFLLQNVQPMGNLSLVYNKMR